MLLLLEVYLLANASVSHRRSSLQQEGWQRWAQSKAACLVASLSLQQAPFWHRRRPPPRRVPMLARDLSSQLACAMCVCVCSLSREHRCSTTSGYRQRATVQIEQRIGCLPLCCEACYKSLRVCPRPAMVRLENVQRREGQHRG